VYLREKTYDIYIYIYTIGVQVRLYLVDILCLFLKESEGNFGHVTKQCVMCMLFVANS
jgi:hypothetical protein